MNKLKLSFYLIALISAGACSSTGIDGLGQSVTVTHSYSSQTTVSSSAPTQIVQDQHRRFQIRLAIKNSTSFPVKIFFNPDLQATGYVTGDSYTFPISRVGFLVPRPDIYLSPGEIQIYSGTQFGKPEDAFRLCWSTTNPLESYGVCTPTDIFLGRFPAAPLRMLLTIRGDYPGFAESGLSLARVVMPRRKKKIQTIIAGPGKTFKFDHNPAPINRSDSGGFVP
ncbi:MAG: hypothetical protein ACYCT9_00465 [Leptospirillum sp.]|jgi:hypothetical protein